MTEAKEPDYSWIDPEKIKQWEAEGHWPPPRGMVLLPEIEVGPMESRKTLLSFANLLKPDQQKIVRKIVDRVYPE